MSEKISDTNIIDMYEMPSYSIIDQQQEGLTKITTVIMDGEIMEFEVRTATVRHVDALLKAAGVGSE